MTIRNVSDLVQAENDGKSFFTCWRKQPTQTTGAGIWFDLSMSPGNPVPNYYAAAPNVAIALSQSTDGGILHGQNVSQLGFKKYLKTFGAFTVTGAAVPLPMLLLDYLMFYPFVDMSVTDEQPMTTSIALPRYPTGEGVEIMAVEVAGQSGVGNPQFYVGYTNQAGVTGRYTRVAACNTQLVNGTIITSAVATNLCVGPFLQLQDGDTGVQKIDSVTFLTADIGLIAFVLVKPITNHSIRTIDSAAERSCFIDHAQLAEIKDDAYLNLIALPQGTLAAANIFGYIQTVWG
jgi:hypothetical protein